MFSRAWLTRWSAFAATLCFSAAASSSCALAQVMEIGGGGAVTTYDGPTVFTDAGASPILRPRPKAANRKMRAREDSAAIAAAADGAALSPALIEAVAERESGFRVDAVSKKGALGEMQLMEATARAVGVDRTDPRQNLKGGASYLASLMRRYNGDLIRTLAAYNAGPGAVDRYRGVPPFKETQAYVDAILNQLSRDVAISAVHGVGR